MNKLTPEAAQLEILRLLNSSSKPLSKSKILAGKGGSARGKTLSFLLKTKRVVNLGSPRNTAFVAAPEGETLDLTAKTENLILENQPAKPTPLSFTKLKALVKYPELQGRVIEAVGNLVKKKQGIMFKCGSGTYFLHLAPIRELLSLPTNGSGHTHPADPDRPQANVDEIIVSRYRDLVRETGTPDISIASLIRVCGLPLSIVHNWLRAECSAHRASPSKGEPTLATPEERMGALTVDGETFYLIRLLR